jgi:hypothetical protein
LPQPPRQIALPESLHVIEYPAVGQSIDELSRKEVHGETTVLEHVLAVRVTGP